MASLAAVSPRLAKLLPMLSSNQPGEVAAAAAAIGRTLASVGADWHDLAAILTAPPAARSLPPPPKKGRAPELGMMLEELARLRPGVLSAWEAQFIANVGRYWRKGKALSDRQTACLRGIHARVHGHG